MINERGPLALPRRATPSETHCSQDSTSKAEAQARALTNKIVTVDGVIRALSLKNPKGSAINHCLMWLQRFQRGRRSALARLQRSGTYLW